jgi:serine/threonine protein kinase
MPDLTIKGHLYSVKLRRSGDLCNVYSINKRILEDWVVKVAKVKTDNDLVWNEAGVLGYLNPPGTPDEGYFRYFPRLLDSFETLDGFRANVLVDLVGYVSVEDVLTAFPKGLYFRDVAWMYKRLLVGLGYAHNQGVIHGAILPPHVLIHPTGHGAKIIDWSYSLNLSAIVKPKADPTAPAVIKPSAKEHNAWTMLLDDSDYDPDPVLTPTIVGPPPDPNRKYIQAISVAHEKFYAPEVFAKKTPTPATDIYMAAKVAVALLGGNVETNQMPDSVPVQIKAFLQASLLPATRLRPQDAWELHDAFTALLLNVVGKPTYRPLVMPLVS